MEEDEGFEINDETYNQLTKEQKYEVLQYMYQQYQQDPECFPEEQRQILERELEIMFNMEGEGELDEEDMMLDEDERMQMEGKINFPHEPAHQHEDEQEEDQDRAPSPPKQPEA